MTTNFEIWENTGIPSDEPAFASTSLAEVRDYLLDNTYSDLAGKIRGCEGEIVYCNGVEIPLDAFLSDVDFYSCKEWGKIVEANK